MPNLNCIRRATPTGGAIVLALVTPMAIGGGGTSPCTTVIVPVAPCTGSCSPRWIAATEVDGVRHVFWRQAEESQVVRTLRVDPDGEVLEGEIPVGTGSSGPNLIQSIAARGDLLVVGYPAGLSFFRLVDDAWELEQSFAGPTHVTGRLAIGTDPDGVERVVALPRAIAINGAAGFDPARIYRRDATWTLEDTLPITSPFTFGADVAFDGVTIAIGDPKGSTALPPATGVRLYQRVSEDWVLTSTLSFDNEPPDVPFVLFDPYSLGQRVTLRGDTLVAMNGASNVISNTLTNGVGGVTNLVVFQRDDGVWQQTDVIRCPSTRFGMGYELASYADGDDVVVVASIRRKFSPLIDGAIAFRIRDGVVISETPLRITSAEPGGLDAATFGIAVVASSSPWVAVTVPSELETAIRIIELDPTRCAPMGTGDLDGDGVVDASDLGLLLSQWGPCVGCIADLNGDGFVDAADLGILLNAWSANP